MTLLVDVLKNENLKDAKILAPDSETTLECCDADGYRPVCVKTEGT